MGKKFSLTCDKESIRVDAFLAEKLSITRTKTKGMIEGGSVRVLGKKPKPSLNLKAGMVVEGEIPEEEPLSLAPQTIPLQILYEDEYFLAINKPKGMVVHPSFGHKEGTLVNAVLGYVGQGTEKLRTQNSELRTPGLASSGLRPGIVHRLDKGTTGVIIVAKDSRTQEMLSALFKKRDVHKTYRAVVEGEIKKNESLIEGNIGRHPVDRKRMAVLKKGGREASTSFKVLDRLKGFTYVEAYPKTGRTHQIRVHLAHIGHPVAGDGMYGRKAKHVADRPLLHAYKIEFIHPVTAAPISIKASVPEDMTKFIEGNSLNQSQRPGSSQEIS